MALPLQDFPSTWQLPCSLFLLRLHGAKMHARLLVHSVRLLDRRNAPSVLLDDCDSRPPPPAQSGTDILLSLSCPDLLFWKQPVGSQLPNLLWESADKTVVICMGVSVSWLVVRAAPTYSSTRLLRLTPRTDSHANS